MSEQDCRSVKVTSGAAFAVPVLQALGVDPSAVISFSITCDSCATMLDIKRVMREADSDAIALIAQRFELKLKDESAAVERLPLSVQAGEAPHG